MKSLDRVAEEISGILDTSVADETSVAWLEFSRTRASGHRERRSRPERREVLIRVLERGRHGFARTTSSDRPELERCVRLALAHARAHKGLIGYPHLPSDATPSPRVEGLWDPAIADLHPQEMAARMKGLGGEGERSTLSWTLARVVVGNSKGLLRRAKVTSVDLAVRSGTGPGFGHATGAARRLADLEPEEIFDRARRRRVRERDLESKIESGAPVLLAPEAAAQVFSILSRVALTAQSYRQGESFLRDHLGVQVFDRGLSIVDDGTDPEGLPFPFDLEGTCKAPVSMIDRGTPRTPALDQFHAALLGLSPTPHAWAGDDARPEHLFVLPGTLEDEEIVAAADGGVRVSILERLECFDPRRVKIRAIARGVRHVRNGRLGAAAPDMIWETSLLQALGQVGGLGRRRRRIADPASLLGSICSPGILLSGSLNLQPVPAAARRRSGRRPGAGRR